MSTRMLLSLLRPEYWPKEAKREYASIIFSTAVMHFPLGLVFLISGILLGELSFYLDLTLGVALLSSGIIAIISTQFIYAGTVNLSVIVSFLSAGNSIALVATMFVLTFEFKTIVPANPIVWIYILFSLSALALEIVQLYYELRTVRTTTSPRHPTTSFSQAISLHSDVTAHDRTLTERTELCTTKNQQLGAAGAPRARTLADNNP